MPLVFRRLDAGAHLNRRAIAFLDFGIVLRIWSIRGRCRILYLRSKVNRRVVIYKAERDHSHDQWIKIITPRHRCQVHKHLKAVSGVLFFSWCKVKLGARINIKYGFCYIRKAKAALTDNMRVQYAAWLPIEEFPYLKAASFWNAADRPYQKSR